jgi:hypothetical protein
MRPLLFSRSCLWFLPPSAVKKSRSQRVEELGSQPPTPSFGSQLGETAGRSWTFRLANFSTREPGKRAGRHDSEKTQNNTNEASMLLKTQGAFGKQTQNELKNEPNLGCLWREPNSEVARLDGKKPLTWLATLATLLGEEGAEEVWSATPKQAMRENTKIGGTKRECL